MDFTVVGDTVNVAQRLETKTGPWEILMHENVFSNFEVATERLLTKVTGLKLKGKTEETIAYRYKKTI